MTIVCAVSDTQILNENLLASSFLIENPDHQLVALRNSSSAATAYNQAIREAENNLIIFAHQDLFFPPSWLSELENALNQIEAVDPNWGVLGVWGVAKTGQTWGHVYSTGWGVIGKPFPRPMEVQTLDEIVLILRKASELWFDERLPHFHLYGTSICLSASELGLKCYAIPAFCIHNTEQILTLPAEFYTCYRYIKRVWKEQLPIHTSCIKICRFDTELWIRRLEGAFPRRQKRVLRHTSPHQVLAQLQAEGSATRSPTRGRSLKEI